MSERMKLWIADKMKELMKRKPVEKILNTDELDPMLLYCIRYYCYGAVGMAKEWINQDSKVPAETFVEMTHSCMPQALSDIFASKFSA